MLAAALAWAARGFRVFPIVAGTKDQPAVEEFHAVATSDPVAIRMWWADPLTGAERDYNVGVSTTGMVVIDIDTKRGQPGFENYLTLGGHFDTLVVKTPSGGRHAYYRGDDCAGRVGLLGRDSGLDIRSYHNYVLAPGSEVAEGVYSLEVDTAPADLPAEFKPHLRPPLERVSGEVQNFAETPAMIERAVTFLQSAEAAIEGAGGDDQTFKTIARLRDLGISEDTAAVLVAAYYNPRCVPPWSDEDIRGKVANAYAYGTAAFGVLSPETHYEGLKVPEGNMLVGPVDAPAGGSEGVYTFGNATEPLAIAPRPWLYTRLLMRRKVALISGAGSAGKSLLSLQIAAHLAVGKNFHGYHLKDGKATRSIIYNGEDDLDEQSRRLWAICAHFKFDWPTVKAAVAIVSRSRAFRLALTEGENPKVNNDHVVPLIKAALDHDVGFIGLDPLVTLHSSKEVDNQAMRYVMETAEIVAEETNAAVAISHHIAKPGANTRMDEMYAARGGTEIINAVRMGVNLSSPSATEAISYGIEPADRRDFVAMTDAKFNNAKALVDPKWFRKVSVRLPNGDEVGVLDPYDMAGKQATMASVHAAILAKTMLGRGVAHCTLNEAADMLRAADLLMTKMSPKELIAKVMSALASPAVTEDGTVKIIQELVGGKLTAKVVLE